MNINYHFGKALNSYLRDKGITDIWLANKLGISSQAVKNYFNADNPRKNTVDKILKALEINLDTLISYSENMVINEPINEYKSKPKPTIELNIEEYEYLMKALRERDELKNKEIERLQEANRAVPETH